MNPVIEDLLVETLGENAVVMGDELSQLATSYWNSEPTQGLAMVRPRSTAEVSQVLQICHQYEQPVVTHGGRTGCVQGSESEAYEIILSLERMNAIEAIDPVGGTATVEGGAVLQVVQETLAAQGLLFPLDLGARGSCTIGGNVATNAGGINVLRYGMMRNLVLGLEAVLVDGTVVSSMNQMLKNNAGYDLKQLFIGSEGTLGVVTRVVLKLFPKPLSRQTALVAMEDFGKVVEFLQTLQRDLAGTLSAYEVMWQNYFHAVTVEGWHRAPMDRDYPFYVVLESEGADLDADDERFNRVLEKAFEDGVIVDAVLPKSETERIAIWEIRENFEALLETKPAYIYDVSLPINNMAAYIDLVQVGVEKRWSDGLCFVLGHIADGNLHLFVKPGLEGDFHYESDVEVYEPLKAFNGSVSAEHGIGKEKKAWLGHSRSAIEIEMMRSLKQVFDPKEILNRGRIFDLND